MIDKILIKYIEKHTNGHVILNDKKMVIYANYTAKEIFSEKTFQSFGNFVGCNNTVIEQKSCQKTSKCKDCMINSIINKILEDKDRSIIENLEFAFKSEVFNISFEVKYIDGYIIIEFIRVDRDEDEIYLLNRIFNKSKDLLFYKDDNLIYKYVNKSYAEFLGLEKKYIIGKSDADILPKEMIEKCLKTDNIAINYNTYSGVEVVGDTHYRVLKECVDNGIIGIAQNITQEVELRKAANVDDLTKLRNRRKFNSDIEKIYKMRVDKYYIILIDIDDFSNINNTYGHDIGDIYLRELGLILGKFNDLIFYRLGGDEFIGLISADIKKVKERVKDITNELEKVNKIKISMGVKKLDTTIDYNENYNLLDKALYSSKRKGKNQVTYNDD